MSLTVTYTERAWAIDLIAHLKSLAHNSNRAIMDAGGEQSIHVDGGNLFPDVILFGDRATARILQGWELKMPDTKIDDRDLYLNAAKKAKALGLDSFVLWNVKCARLYVLKTYSRQFVCEKEWPRLNHIVDRASVRRHSEDWKELANTIVSDLNDLFENGAVEGRPFVEAYRTGGIQELILSNVEEVAHSLRNTADRDSSLRTKITLWWEKHKHEYIGKYTDRYDHLALANLSNWIGKLLFVHVLRSQLRRVRDLVKLDANTTPANALHIFLHLSKQCDFWTVFSDSVGLSIIPKKSWNQLLQFNNLLSDLRVESIDQRQLAEILEGATRTVVRKVRGQYATPPALAKLMAALALRNIAQDRSLDPCCGTGTITRAMLELKQKAGVSPQEAASTVFAGDLDPFAVQIATLSMVTPAFMNIPLRVFCKDAFNLSTDTELYFIDPTGGNNLGERLGSFNSIASNLPFISQQGRTYHTDSIEKVRELVGNGRRFLSGRSDISAYFPFALHSILNEDGRLVIIISNAWLSTDWGNTFFELISQYYRVRSIITSGAGRWFQNSKVVANVLFLEKRSIAPASNEDIDFIVLNRPLCEIADSSHAIEVARAQIETGCAHDDSMTIRAVSRRKVIRSNARGLSRNAHFVDCDWTEGLPQTRLSQFCRINRGERRGWDKMFYPAKGHGIESDYIRPVLKSPSTIQQYSVTALDEAFCCSLSIEELEERGHLGALRWIRHFEKEKNNVGHPLPSVLRKSGMWWYEMRSDGMADLVIPINFGERLFVAHTKPRAFVNQRFTRLNCLPGVDIELLMALLNSAISMFYIEGVGFGRGLGALDLSTGRFKALMHVLDPRVLDCSQKCAIKEAFRPLLSREIYKVVDELQSRDRQLFDNAVISAFGLSVDRERIYSSLKRLVAIRLAATEYFGDTT